MLILCTRKALFYRLDLPFVKCWFVGLLDSLIEFQLVKLKTNGRHCFYTSSQLFIFKFLSNLYVFVLLFELMNKKMGVSNDVLCGF